MSARPQKRRATWMVGGLLTASMVAVALGVLLTSGSSSATPTPRVQPPHEHVTQAPALPGAQPISANDRVYTADQSSNTISVINPKTNTVLGTIALGEPRMDVDADVLGAMYNGAIDVHGLGFSLDGNELWVAERGVDTVAVVDWRQERVITRIHTEDGPSKVVFSPDGRLAYVNHLRAFSFDVIDVTTREIIQRVTVPHVAGGSSDEAISPDGKEIWLGMPTNGYTTAVVNAQTYKVQAVLNTGPRTNHPNFVTVDGVSYAYLTVGDLGQTLVYRRSSTGGPPTLVKRIHNSGLGSHGIWPSPDNTRMYVALQYSDAVDVIDTRSMKVIDTLRIGQSPMALVYVARTSPGSTAHIGQQGLGQRIENYPIDVQGVPGAGDAHVRALPGVDEVHVDVRGLPANRAFTVYATRGNKATALLTAHSNAMGVIPEALAFVSFFANHYDKVILRPAGAAGR